MADFNKFLPVLLRNEGGWSNNKFDSGGATMCGVTLATFRSYYGADKTIDDLKQITSEQLSHIYKTGYWDKVNGDNIISQGVANMIADWAVNCGPKKAVMNVQRAIKTTSDGVMGRCTTAKLNAQNAKDLFSLLAEKRRQYYQNIVLLKPSQRVFLKGWLNRVDKIKFE